MKPQLSGADVMLRYTFQAGSPSSSPPNDLGRGRRVKAKPPAVASRAWTQRPRPRAGSYEEDEGGAGHEAPPNQYRSAYDRRAISVPLARVTRGQPGPLGSARDARSAPLAAVTAALPKLIVRVRFSSPALMTKAQAREGVPGLGLAATASGMPLPPVRPARMSW